MYGISFSLLPIQGINGLAIPATPVRGFGEGFHCLLQAANRRIQTGAHFLELPDGGVEFRSVAGVEVSLAAAGDGDSFAPQTVDLLADVTLTEILLPDEVAAANEMLAPKAEAFQIVAQFFIIHVCPFRADLPEKGDRKKEYKKVRPRQKRESRGTPIDERPEIINERKEPGHWEMDTVVGKKKTKARLLVLSERVTRREIIIRIKDGRAETVVQALDRLERIYGAAFYTVFKSITVDNGSEFADADGIARSAINAEEKRTAFYYCHAYCSCERGTNENINRMIRRRFPKGTDFETVTDADVARVEDWINNYPREILGFQSSAQMFSAAFAAAA